MEKKSAAALRWLDTAVKGVRFGPDRAAARAELEAHLEDKEADLRRIFPDMTAEEAETRALSQMGSPEEIGKELARIHKPWLGYLWRASQAALAAVLLMLALTVWANVMNGISTLGGWYKYSDWVADTMPGEQRVELAPVLEEARVEGCRISVPWAFLDQMGEEGHLEAVLRVSSWRFWEKDGRQMEHLTAVDSEGREWINLNNTMGHNISEQRFIGCEPDAGHGPFYQDYRLQVSRILPGTEWIRLEYDWMGRSFSLTIQLEEAEA